MNYLLNSRKMFLIEIIDEQCTITSYDSTSGTISPVPSNNTINSIPISSLYIRLFDDKHAFDDNFNLRTVSLVSKHTNNQYAWVNNYTLDTNSTLYNSNIETYANNITNIIIK